MPTPNCMGSLRSEYRGELTMGVDILRPVSNETHIAVEKVETVTAKCAHAL